MEKESTIGIVSKCVRSYRTKPADTSVVEWLDAEFAQYPEIWQDEAERRLEKQEELNRQLVGRLQDTEDKARGYAELSDRIGEILLSAHREADTVVGEAKQQAREIRNRVSSDGRRMSDELGDLREELGEIRSQMEALSARLSGHY